LEIFSCEFAGKIPSTIGNLTNLKSMVISYSQFSGPIPFVTGQLKALTRLTIEDRSISGRIPSSIVNLTRLVQLQITNTFRVWILRLAGQGPPIATYIRLGKERATPFSGAELPRSPPLYVWQPSRRAQTSRRSGATP
jgi:hypothetical protein